MAALMDTATYRVCCRNGWNGAHNPSSQADQASQGGLMSESAAEWISSNILPYEAEVRRWLRRTALVRADEDDLIQEAYCRLANLADRSQIQSGRAYFYVVVKNLLLERLRRERIVRIDAAEIDLLCIESDVPSPERECTSRQQLALVQHLIEGLPEPCRSVFRMRKIESLSQRETAHRLGLSENVVEKQVAAGVRMILKALEGREAEAQPGAGQVRRDIPRNQRRN
jgi:RNA polymerase sigma-70 factor (ECF subfamily)